MQHDLFEWLAERWTGVHDMGHLARLLGVPCSEPWSADGHDFKLHILPFPSPANAQELLTISKTKVGLIGC